MFRWSSSGQFKQPSGSILWMAPEGNFFGSGAFPGLMLELGQLRISLGGVYPYL